MTPEGIEGFVPFSGSVSDVINDIAGGIRSGMGYLNAARIQELRGCRWVEITSAGREESATRVLST